MVDPVAQDGKSQTASGVDQASYPEQHKVDHPGEYERQIRQRAHELWVERGRQEGSAARDWADAEEEVTGNNGSRHDLNKQRSETGSVQK